MLHEHYLLIVAINELELAFWLADRERQTRKPCSGANIENAIAMQKGSGHQAVEQVPCDHLGRIANRRKVDLFVPARELAQQGRELFARVCRQFLPEAFDSFFD